VAKATPIPHQPDSEAFEGKSALAHVRHCCLLVHQGAQPAPAGVVPRASPIATKFNFGALQQSETAKVVSTGVGGGPACVEFQRAECAAEFKIALFGFRGGSGGSAALGAGGRPV